MGKPREPQGYVDVDYVGDLDQGRSTTGYMFTIADCAISWKAKLQDTIALQKQRWSTWLQLRYRRKLCG